MAAQALPKRIDPRVSDWLSLLWQFPVWWYGAALVDLVRELRTSFLGNRRFFQIRLLLRHQFSPLFGGKGWEMHAISIFLRIPLTLGVLAWTVILLVAMTFIVIGWLLLPIAVLWCLFFQLHLLPLTPLHLILRS